VGFYWYQGKQLLWSGKHLKDKPGYVEQAQPMEASTFYGAEQAYIKKNNLNKRKV
jgi:hypothetical protein